MAHITDLPAEQSGSTVFDVFGLRSSIAGAAGDVERFAARLALQTLDDLLLRAWRSLPRVMSVRSWLVSMTNVPQSGQADPFAIEPTSASIEPAVAPRSADAAIPGASLRRPHRSATRNGRQTARRFPAARRAVQKRSLLVDAAG
jgi:hypothetical protein